MAPRQAEWPEDYSVAAKSVKLASLKTREVRQLFYTYDMGDAWRHSVVVETVRPAEPGTKYPCFVAGERRCPPEDVGGLPGVELFLDAMKDPAHEEHQELHQWYGGPFDPENLDEVATQRSVATIAVRRHAGKAAYEKRRDRH